MSLIVSSKTISVSKGDGCEEEPQSYKQTDWAGPKSDSRPSRPDRDKGDTGEQAVVVGVPVPEGQQCGVTQHWGLCDPTS